MPTEREANRQLRWNDTFQGSAGDHHFNACVGENGLNDTYQYAEGYLRAAELLLENLCENKLMGDVDLLIYPISYNARHGIELVLKAVLLNASNIRPTAIIDTKSFFHTHDLNILWRKTKDHLSLIDRRFTKYIDELEPHISDYAEIDPNGQIFRYPTSIETGEQHLIDVSIININILRERFIKLLDLLEDLHYVTISIQREYLLATFTNKLSRYDLECIANKLPPRSEWGDDSFETVRQSVIDEYSLSRNDLYKALDKIQEHPTFAKKIGITIPLGHITPTPLSQFMSAYNSKDITSLENFSNEFIAEVSALYELGRGKLKCENFQDFYNKELADLTHERKHGYFWHYISHYFGKANYTTSINSGLLIMGQEH